jgi:hypothetical protein
MPYRVIFILISGIVAYLHYKILTFVDWSVNWQMKRFVVFSDATQITT